MLNKIASYVRWFHIKKPGCLSFYFDKETICALIENQIAAINEEIARTRSKIASVLSNQSSNSSTPIGKNPFGLLMAKKASEPAERANASIAEPAWI